MAASLPLLVLLVLAGRTSSAVLSGADHAQLVGPLGVDPELDCALRNLTWAYALDLLPTRAPLLSVFDALRLAIDCNLTRPAPLPPRAALPAPYYASPPPLASVLRTLPLPPPSAAGRTWYIDAAAGADAAACGALARPCATLPYALQLSRAAGGGGALVLRASAPHVLAAPLALTPADSGLSIAAYPGEAPVLSGGAHLPPLAWARVGPSPDPAAAASVWAAPLPQGVAAPFAALFDPTARRAVRARFPNGNPEDLSGLMPNGWTKAAAWLPPVAPNTALAQVDPQLGTQRRAACPPGACTPGGPSGGGPPWAIFCCFFWGRNGTAENFTSGSFWGVHPGPPGGASVRTPGGLVVGGDLAPRLAAWARPTDAVWSAFHGSYWGSWAWGTRRVNASSGAVEFGAGGWQEARGAGAGDYLYVENLREELDAAGEWWLDAPARVLYYCANGTAAPPAAGWVAGQLAGLVSLQGSAEAPVADVALAGLTFAYTEPTFLQPFTAPSGGDWSFQDGGALRLSGTRNCSVSGSYFVNLGGSGVVASGWNVNATVSDCEFKWLGECAVIGAGLGGDAHDNSAPSAPVGRGLTLQRNLAHELGLFVKQSGFYYHAMGANASVLENVFFNGARAGININDGFGGGHEISRNVGFNMVRETSDHGPINTWDRNTYAWRAGPGGTDALPSRISRNLLHANYHSVTALDHDDGSNGWVDTENVLLWSGTKNLMGYNKRSQGNLFVYVDYNPALLLRGGGGAQRIGWSAPETKPAMCAGYLTPFPSATAQADAWVNNSCIAASNVSLFRFPACNSSNPLDGSIPVPLAGNSYYTTNASYQMRCGGEVWGLPQAQARGVDVGATLHALPSTEQLLGMARQLLQLQ